MAKGYLNIKQLESMKKAELQDLAKKLGVSDAGTVKELVARIAAVEVDIPEESELTEEEKVAAGVARQEEERAAAEQAAKEQEEAEQAAKEAAEKAAAEQKAREEAEAAAALVKVRAVTRFLDKQINQIKDAGEAYKVSRERAEELVAAGVAEIVK